MTKILTSRKYKSNNPFTKYMQKNIEERYLVYHEDWKNFDEVRQKLTEQGWQVRVWNVIEEKEMKADFTVSELTAIKKALYFYNSYYTREYKQNGRKLPSEYDEESVNKAEEKTRMFLGENVGIIYGR